MFLRLAMCIGMIMGASAARIVTPDGFERITPNGYVAGIGPIKLKYNTTVESCAISCLSDSACKGFNWHIWNFGCQLEPVDYATAAADGHWTTEEYGFWIYYSKVPRRPYLLQRLLAANGSGSPTSVH
mmetsp:Transcript_50197/g.92735  ORF Transcript_50197/g.92735 Transcript_50197/m.92735 type:complete len:128 (+) Transcript_50197:87-470(+)